MILLRSGSATDVGLIRPNNQDVAFTGKGLFVVADGLGGHVGGEVAAKLAVDTLVGSFFINEPQQSPGGEDLLKKRLLRAVSQANHAIWKTAYQNSELRGMGTTLTAAVWVSNGEDEEAGKLIFAHVGDSRAYILHRGCLKRLTVDHNVKEELKNKKQTSKDPRIALRAKHVLTRALGVEPTVNIDMFQAAFLDGDRLMLCTDGLTNEVDEDTIADVLTNLSDPTVVAEELVRQARANGGNDNITVVVVDATVLEEGTGLQKDDLQKDSSADIFIAAQSDDSGGISSFSDPDLPSTHPFLHWLRNLFTLRFISFILLLAALAGAVFLTLRWVTSHSYFVGLDKGYLAIYKGRSEAFLGFSPKLIQKTDVKSSQILQSRLPDLQNGVEVSSLHAAWRYVNNLVKEAALFQNNPTTTTTLANTNTTVGSG